MEIIFSFLTSGWKDTPYIGRFDILTTWGAWEDVAKISNWEFSEILKLCNENALKVPLQSIFSDDVMTSIIPISLLYTILQSPSNEITCRPEQMPNVGIDESKMINEFLIVVKN